MRGGRGRWLAVAAALLAGAGTCAVRSWTGAADPHAAGASPAGSAAGAPGPSITGPSGPGRFADAIDASSFLRGNLHTHSKRSDGDAPPGQVYAHYRDRGYAFVVLTDHNTRTDPAELAAERRPGFVMIAGEEVTTLGAGKPVHVNAICSRATIGGGAFPTVREALAWAVGRVKEQGAIALVNHPNFEWALGEGDLPAGRGAELLEIWSGHPYVRSEGDALHPSHEALWAKMLDAGEGFAGVAVDDMHNLIDPTREPRALPLRAWVQVFGAEVSEAAICDGLRRGRLYASAGPELARILVKGSSMALRVTAPARVEFVGAEGAVLSAVEATAEEDARYDLRGGERYVRARITGADGRRAWTQAYRVVRE
jgi:hypothetical protein